MSDPSSDPDRGRGRDDDGRRRDVDRRDPDVKRRPVTGRRGRDAGRRRREREWRRHESERRDADRRSVDRHDVEMYGIDRTNPPTVDPADDPSNDRAPVATSTLRWLSGVVSLVGLWIAASAVVYDPTTVALWNNVATGGAVFLLAGFGFVRTVRGDRPDAEAPGLAALLGLWAVVAPLLLTYGSPALVWSTMASGVAVAVLSGYNAYENRRTEPARTAGSRV